MNENEMVIKLCRAFFIAGVSIMALGVGCKVDSTRRVAEMVKTGANPLEAYCAVGGQNYMMCAVVAAQKER